MILKSSPHVSAVVTTHGMRRCQSWQRHTDVFVYAASLWAVPEFDCLACFRLLLFFPAVFYKSYLGGDWECLFMQSSPRVPYAIHHLCALFYVLFSAKSSKCKLPVLRPSRNHISCPRAVAEPRSPPHVHPGIQSRMATAKVVATLTNSSCSRLSRTTNAV